jgi:hypothetical protein
MQNDKDEEVRPLLEKLIEIDNSSSAGWDASFVKGLKVRPARLLLACCAANR